MTAPQAGAKGDSKAGRGDVLAEEGYTPKHKRSWPVAVVRSTNSPVLDCAETRIRSIQGIRVQISKTHCYIRAQPQHSSGCGLIDWVKGEGFSLSRLCR